MSAYSNIEFQVIISEDQADFAIMQLARYFKQINPDQPIVVLSCDYDFLALAPPGWVNALLDPTRGFIIWKEDVSALLGVAESVLFNAYAVAGCDDISVNLKGVGFQRALKFASMHGLEKIKEEFDQFDPTVLPSLFK